MPYTIKKSGNKYKVCKKAGNKCFGTHDTKKKAVAQIGAISSSENESQTESYLDFNMILEACWDGYEQQGMKKKGKRMVPNCVPKKRKKKK
jgi:hypothetical protein